MRLKSLDGLRGFAALAVISHHLLLVDPWFSNALSSPGSLAGGGLKRIIYYSPLHLPFMGTEAVMLFFVMSGFVLARGNSGMRSLSRKYFLSRSVRLYFPIWASLLSGFLLLFLRPLRTPTNLSSWALAHFSGISASQIASNPGIVLGDLLVVPGNSMLNSSLWSMRFELTASLLLFCILWVSRAGCVSVLASLVLTLALGNTPFSWFFDQLPFFLTGVVLSKRSKSISRTTATLLICLGIAAFTFPWVLRGLEQNPALDKFSLTLIMLLGASSLCLGVANVSFLSPLLEAKLAQYLGSRSYSLYLVHAPVVLLVSYWVFTWSDGSKYWPLWVVPTLFLSLGLAEIFFRLVEIPTLSMARKIKDSAVKIS